MATLLLGPRWSMMAKPVPLGRWMKIPGDPVVLAIMTLMLASSPSPAQAPAPVAPASADRKVIADVKVTGNQNIPTDKIMRYIHTRPGMEYNPSTLYDDVTRLMESRMFKSVRPNEERTKAGLVICFQLVEFPNIIQEVIFNNAHHFSQNELEGIARVRKGNLLDPTTNRNALFEIQDYLKKKGYFWANVILEEGDKETHTRVVFNITEGPPCPEITIDAPAEGFVDQPLAFKIHLQNTSKEALKKLRLVAISDVITTGTVPLVNRERSEPLRNLTEIRAELQLPVLAPEQQKTIELELSPGRVGKFGVKVLLTTGLDLRNITSAGEAAAVVNIKIDPKTPLKALLPDMPKQNALSKSMLPQNLAQIAELAFQEPLPRSKSMDAFLLAANTISKIHHVNEKKTDAFMETLLSRRSDLAGLPFAMGDTCRLREERGRQFADALVQLRKAMALPVPMSLPPPASENAPAPAPSSAFKNNHSGKAILENFRKYCDDAEKADKRIDPAIAENSIPARIAALMQVLGPEPPEMRIAMVHYLEGIAHIEATRALARLAIFSEEADVRDAAIKPLNTRRERDYTDILLNALSYPWPAVAKRAGEAIAKLQRTDLLPQLVQALDRPDPRTAHLREVNGEKVTVVRELVRINHHRNCLLCHAPANMNELVTDRGTFINPGLAKLLAQVPLPTEPLPTPDANSGGYSNSIPDILVRVDVTYLRQDFSVRLPVADAAPWPEMQRFDFLVRTRQVTAAEAKAYDELLQPRRPGELSPYHRAALYALRELTGLDTAPTAEAWRKLLKRDP